MGRKDERRKRRHTEPGQIPVTGRSAVLGASLDQEKKGPQLRYLLAIRADSNGQVSFDINAMVDDVTHFEVGRALLALAQQSFMPKNLGGKMQESFQIRIERQDLVSKKQHKEDVTRDYPAMRFHPAKNWYLCAACLDAYAGTAAPVEEFLELPEEMSRVACTFHFDDSKRPFTYEHAAELKTQLEEDARLAAEDAARQAEGGDDDEAGASGEGSGGDAGVEEAPATSPAPAS